MKHIKQLLVAALTVFLAAVLAVPAFAEDPTASITINPNNPAGTSVSTEYTYYELLHASIQGSGNSMKVSYYLNDGTEDTLRTLLDAVTVDGVDLFTFTKSADGTRWIATINEKAPGVAFTDADGPKIAAALNTDAIKDAALISNDFAQDSTTGNATTGQVDPGYYLVTSTLGTKLVVDTLDNVTINTKNSYPGNAKSASKTNMEVGDKVEYKIEVTIPDTAVAGDKFTVYDKLDEHLAILDSNDAIAATDDARNITAFYGTDTTNTVTLTKETAKPDGTFARSFTLTADMITAGKVTLVYKAELLSTAAADNGYVNEAFTETPAFETLPTTVRVYTFDFDLWKVFKNNGTVDETATLQATFKLYRATDADTASTPAYESTALSFVESDATGGGKNYVLADSDDTTKTDTITIVNKTVDNISGLAAGTYYLVEQSTSDGFNLLTTPVRVVITDTTQTNDENPSHAVSPINAAGQVEVENQSGIELPSTGGMGTTILYMVGGCMVVAGIVMFLTKRRMASLEK